MKTTFSSKVMRTLILAASLTGSAGFLSPAFGQSFDASYLIDLNTKEWTKLEALGEFTSARAINDSGQVVGLTGEGIWDVSPRYIRTGFITGPNGAGIRALSINDPRDINNAGQVVGMADPYDAPVSDAYISGPNGEGGTLIKPLSEYSYPRFTQAFGINEAGQVAGHSLAMSPTGEWGSHAFITGPNGVGTIDLGFYGIAADINNKGQAVGEVFLGGFSTHAFTTGPNGGGMTDLGNLGSSGFVSGINDSGRVVGGFETAPFSPDSRHAFITGPNGHGMIDLGTLGGSFSSAMDINEAGQVVGSSDTALGSRHAFVTGPDGTGMTDLNSLVDLPKGVILASATGINNVGQVVAIAMVPEPSSYALMLAGLALVGAMIRRRYPFLNEGEKNMTESILNQIPHPFTPHHKPD